jgi:hypothetical protein
VEILYYGNPDLSTTIFRTTGFIYMNLFAMLQAAPGQTPVPLPLPSPTASWDDPVTVATVVVAIFTVVSVIVSAFMWSETREQARISREIFEAAHRPYIGITELSGAMSIQGKVHGWVTVLIKNSGSVPAYRLKILWRLSIGDIVLPDTKTAERVMVLLPDDPTRITLDYYFSQDYMEKLNGAPLDILVTIKYKGVTDKEYNYTQHAVYNRSDERGYVMTEADST